MRKKGRNIALLALLVLASLLAPMAHCAYPERIAALKQEVNVKYNKPEVLVLADSLRRYAVATGDKQLEVFSLFAPLKYYFYTKAGLQKIEESMVPILEKSRKYDMQAYFYSAVSYKVTYLINNGKYAEALEYQGEMVKYAKKYGHHQGVILGHVSLGNVHRMRMQMVRAISEYEQAIEGYKKYKIEHEFGQDYKRIADCYLVVGQFERALKACDDGLASTKYDRRIGGLLGYKAFILCMLGRDKEFAEVYKQYEGYKSVAPDIPPVLAKSLEALKMIHDGKDAEVEKILKNRKIEGFWIYVKIYYEAHKKHYAEERDAWRMLYADVYGKRKNFSMSPFLHMSTTIENNIQELDKQKAEYENSRLDLARTNLELQQKNLQLRKVEKAERMSLLDAENNRLAYNNQKMMTQQLTDSLRYNKQRQEFAEKEHNVQVLYMSLRLVGVVLLLIFAVVLFLRNNKLVNSLKATNAKLKQNMDELVVASERAEESDRQKTVFIQNISHELRTPLNSIVGFSEVLARMEDELDEQEKHDINAQVMKNSDLLSKLINDVLDLAKIESGTLAFVSEETNVASVCRRAIDDTRIIMPEGVEMHFESSLPDDYVVTTDANRIHQVLVNMITNSEKNTTEGSITLSCGLTEDGGSILFAVTDTGIGVPKDKQEEIFRMFKKLDVFKQGTGLGLSLCHTIAEKLGGDFYIDSGYCHGARFCFTIPVR